MSESTDEGLFAITRGLCTECRGDLDRVKAALYLRGVAPMAAARAIFEMRKEGVLPRAEKDLTPRQRWMRDARAGQMHLVDLKRAGHSPRVTELRIEPDGHLSATELRTRRLREAGSIFGSPAAACAEFAE